MKYDNEFVKNENTYQKSFDLFKEALEETDKTLLNDSTARRSAKRSAVKGSSRLSRQALHERNFSIRKPMLRSKKLNEQLRYGADPEELEAEVLGSFGKSVLKICQKHNITGKAIWEALDILKMSIGEDPNVDLALQNWAQSEDSNTVDEELEESSKGYSKKKNLEESSQKVLQKLRRKLAEKRLRARM